MKDDILNAGANYEDKEVVYDERIFTTAHYKDMTMDGFIDKVYENKK